MRICLLGTQDKQGEAETVFLCFAFAYLLQVLNEEEMIALILPPSTLDISLSHKYLMSFEGRVMLTYTSIVAHAKLNTQEANKLEAFCTMSSYVAKCKLILYTNKWKPYLGE